MSHKRLFLTSLVSH